MGQGNRGKAGGGGECVINGRGRGIGWRQSREGGERVLLSAKAGEWGEWRHGRGDASG